MLSVSNGVAFVLSSRSPPPFPTTSRFFPVYFYESNLHTDRCLILRRQLPGRPRFIQRPMATASLLLDSPLVRDGLVSVVTAGSGLALLRFWEELAKRGVFEQKLRRKLVHISVGSVFMLFWPLFSSGSLAPYLASLAAIINVIRLLLLGLGILKNDAIVQSMSRFGDHRELLKGPLYYVCTITLATCIFWRTSPLAVAAICNMCAGDGLADIVGRKFGRRKHFYNSNKSIVGSIAMFLAGFLASVGYMHYFHCFGFMEESWGMAMRFLFVSLIAAFVESLPISSQLDDNLTVPLTSFVVGSLVF